MTMKASVNISLNDTGSEIVLTGSYENVVMALCAGIKGLITNMTKHPKYIEIKEKSKLSDEEFENELIYSVMLSIMDKLDNYYVISMSNKDDPDMLNKDTTDNTVTDIDFNGFEEVLKHLENKENNNRQENE